MKVILTKDIERVGEAGSVIKVSPGYARNYLLPKKLAIPATKGNIARIEKIKKKAEIERLEQENKYKALAASIDGTELRFVRKADENDHLYGSVSENDIAEDLEAKGFEVHKSNIKLDKHLKELGAHTVKIAFAPDIVGEIQVIIEKE